MEMPESWRCEHSTLTSHRSNLACSVLALMHCTGPKRTSVPDLSCCTRKHQVIQKWHLVVEFCVRVWPGVGRNVKILWKCFDCYWRAALTWWILDKRVFFRSVQMLNVALNCDWTWFVGFPFFHSAILFGLIQALFLCDVTNSTNVEVIKLNAN